MTKYTENYGAINSIIDERKTLSVVDSNGIEFLFEVAPIILDQEKIKKTLEQVKDKNVTFIRYDTHLNRPSNTDIHHAVEEGKIIALRIDCSIIDNYGFIHKAIYNENNKEYNIQLNPVIKTLSSYPEINPLSDDLIDLIKSQEYPEKFLYQLSNTTKIIFNHFTSKNNELNTHLDNLTSIIQSQEKRLLVLEERIRI